MDSLELANRINTSTDIVTGLTDNNETLAGILDSQQSVIAEQSTAVSQSIEVAQTASTAASNLSNANSELVTTNAGWESQNGILVNTIADLSHKMALDYEAIADQIMAIVGDVPEENNEEEQP